ncbi:MAG: addiction module toxin, HicA family [Dehalococcoidia bacterium]|nr:addiction module toxin, HicA family [Dehalococcoidia bacterium]
MAERLPSASGRAVSRLLEGLGFTLVRQRGSHAHFHYETKRKGRLLLCQCTGALARKRLMVFWMKSLPRYLSKRATLSEGCAGYSRP